MIAKWIASLLLVFMPVQFSLAAVVNYCQHESKVETKHLGHHEHKHQVDNLQNQNNIEKNNFVDIDCAPCHSSCFSGFINSIAIDITSNCSNVFENNYLVYIYLRPLSPPDKPPQSLLFA